MLLAPIPIYKRPIKT